MKDYLKFRPDMVSQYILENGEYSVSQVLTQDEHKYVKYLTATFEAKAKQCFYNAQMICLMAGSLEADVKYVEGYAKGLSSMPVHHAWVEVNGKTVDVTLVTTQYSTEQLGQFMRFNIELPRALDLSDRVIGKIPKGWEYYGVKFDSAELAQDFIGRGRSFSKIDDWENEWPLISEKQKKRSVALFRAEIKDEECFDEQEVKVSPKV
jgi:hypothetical protein